MGSEDKTFILSESGHIAGIVNPPSKKKYGHYMNEAWPEDPDDWKAGADFFEATTWWFHWEEWLGARSGEEDPGPQTRRRRAPGALRRTRHLRDGYTLAANLTGPTG